MEELDKLEVLEGWLQHGVWFVEFGDGVRLTGVSIKIQPSGHLAILKGITAEGPKVAFLQLPTIDKLRRKLSAGNGLESIRWRADKFALDKK